MCCSECCSVLQPEPTLIAPKGPVCLSLATPSFSKVSSTVVYSIHHCSVDQCEAVCCSVLKCVAVYCSVLQRGSV